LKEVEKKDPRVEYYGWIKGSELENVYRSTYAVIIPSIVAEPAPYVVNEALLRGRIIIASDIGGIPEQVEGFEGCYLFSPGDSSQLVSIIRDTLSISIDEAREIGYRNREKLLNKGQNDKMLETFEALAKRISV